jgi:hypothetical protein
VGKGGPSHRLTPAASSAPARRICCRTRASGGENWCRRRRRPTGDHAAPCARESRAHRRVGPEEPPAPRSGRSGSAIVPVTRSGAGEHQVEPGRDDATEAELRRAVERFEQLVAVDGNPREHLGHRCHPVGRAQGEEPGGDPGPGRATGGDRCPRRARQFVARPGQLRRAPVRQAPGIGVVAVRHV